MTAFLSVILVTSLSDHFKRRGLLMLICASIAIIGYVMLIATSRPHVQYGGTFLVAAGSFACPPVVMGVYFFLLPSSFSFPFNPHLLYFPQTKKEKEL